ncbi:LLM class flavin-dependent oxidoreductase [Nocardioides daeguensis]|uniref:LLM class flavin-dependent oxidoreductase n=1 Tax=Nocardioides daeguensis TaxID=908359 RepID=UPI001C47257B|nr:LLM class flavin-dependent oxidoreductase [Nocardioides daeguensis]MBV6727993.1 LLM class flavin-dependent oxidoreductase [Nocardioides daeguensis]MCR1774067.1 LLM class flavin-dependent oxidoreductase [Nocardioides daeguensis]
MSELVFGLDTFGDVTLDPATGERLRHPQVVRNVVEQAVLADEVGVDVFGIGEHHRNDFAVTSPEMVLAAIAARTERIRLGTAVTVLSSDDPVRLYERFATLDALSNGRAEITMGRGSFTESFPLFGYDLAHYDQLFSEKIDLWAALQGEQAVTWDRGELRAPLRDARVFPTTERGSIPTWIGVGGSPESVVRAARYGFPLAIAIIGGEPARFAPFTDLYRRALKEYGRPALPIAVHSPGFVADSDDEAREALYPHFTESRNRIGAERGWGPATRAQYDAEVDHGALFVGSPETVARKIATAVRDLGIQRFDLKYSNGAMPHPQLLRSIELYGTRVVPRVRELLAQAPVTA